MGWSLPLMGNKRQALYKLDFALSLTALLKFTSDLNHLLPWAGNDLGNLDADRFSLRDSLLTLVPEPPLGPVLGVRHIGYENTRKLGLFNVLSYQGIGRWLLVNFGSAYRDLTGEFGPHVLLTSATSWLPELAQFHLAVTPDAVLLPPAHEHAGRIEMTFRPIMDALPLMDATLT